LPAGDSAGSFAAAAGGMKRQPRNEPIGNERGVVPFGKALENKKSLEITLRLNAYKTTKNHKIVTIFRFEFKNPTFQNRLKNTK
jgi:hypothetical protein